MEIPRYAHRGHGGGRDGPGLPSIYIDDSNPSPRPFDDAPHPNFSSPLLPAFASIPMSIPNTSDHRHAPPPLPPPRIVPVNGPMSAAAEEYRRRELEPVEELPNYKTRPDRDEGCHSMEPCSRASSFASSFASAKFGLHHDHYQFRSNADAYDNSLLKKLDMMRTLENCPPPRFGGLVDCLSAGLNAPSREPSRPVGRFPTLQTLSLPTLAKQQQSGRLLEPHSRFTETPIHSAISPRSTPFSHYPNKYRSPMEQNDYDRSPYRQTGRTISSSAADDTANADMTDDEPGFPMDETSRLRDFNIDGTVQRPGLFGEDFQTADQNRHAPPSPAGDERPIPIYTMASNENLCWQDGASRESPTPRLANTQDPVPSVSPISRTSSYHSNLSPADIGVSNSGVSFAGPGRRLPGGLSPACGMSPVDTTGSSCTPPYAASISLTISPWSTVRTPHHRILSEHTHALESATRRMPDMNKAMGLLKQTDFFMCDCCPKKPRKFETENQLRAHEMEKLYECNYCGSRFKSKNEAERHQNSLHVRRYSWSCAALSNYDRAFHESIFRPGETDTCGYCGEEFLRSGFVAGRSDARHATEQDWDDRIRHLQAVHKFGECNGRKKFFRADHFRQHLKCSHAGTSGKWSNLLENACMTEEEPPMPMW